MELTPAVFLFTTALTTPVGHAIGRSRCEKTRPSIKLNPSLKDTTNLFSPQHAWTMARIAFGKPAAFGQGASEEADITKKRTTFNLRVWMRLEYGVINNLKINDEKYT